MPIYEYRCSKCDKTFEVIQKFSAAPLTTHEGCGGTVERLLSAPAFHLKGSGWYVTDYAKGSSATEAKTDSKAGSSGDKKSGEKSDGKAEANANADSKPTAGESKSESKSESKAESKSESGTAKTDS